VGGGGGESGPVEKTERVMDGGVGEGLGGPTCHKQP